MRSGCSNKRSQRFADGANSRDDKSHVAGWMEAGRDGAEAAIVLEGSRRHQDGTSGQGKALGGPRDTASCLRALLWAQGGASGKSPHLSNQRTLAMAIPLGLSVASFWPYLPLADFHFLIAAGRQRRGHHLKRLK